MGDEKRDFSRYSLNLPVDPNEPFTGILTVRDYHYFKYPKYCLYSDTDSLVLAAAKKTSMSPHYVISMDSNTIKKRTKMYMGGLKVVNKGFAAVSWHPQTDDSRREMALIKRNKKRKCLLDSVLIPTSGTKLLVKPNKLTDIDEQSCLSIQVSNEKENCHIGKLGDDECFKLTQLENDEYELIIRSPLSLYQGFVISLSRIIK